MDIEAIKNRIAELKQAQEQEARTVETLQRNSLIRAGRIAELEQILKESEDGDGG